MNTIAKDYKQTAVGVIPEHWQVVSLGDIATFFSGGTPRSSNKQYYMGEIPFIGSGDITKRKVNKYITEEALKNSSAKLINKGDLLYALYGATSGAVAISKIDGAINQAILCIRTNENINFIYEFLMLNKQKIIRTFLQGGQGNLSAKIIVHLKILLPPLAEQQKIANILTTWDNAITKQKQLITAKQKLKTALMQQLLTGKTRFKQFSDAWQVVRLGDIFNLKKGNGLSKTKLSKNGTSQCILYGELYTTYNEVIRNVVSKTNENNNVKSLYEDILIPASTTTSAIDLAIAAVVKKTDILIGGDINILRKKSSNVCGEFFANYLTHIKKFDIARYAQGITIIHLYANSFKNLKVKLPPLAEQQKIAAVLTTADNEIALLQKQLTALETEKRGLMQQLLTGKTRVKL